MISEEIVSWAVEESNRLVRLADERMQAEGAREGEVAEQGRKQLGVLVDVLAHLGFDPGVAGRLVLGYAEDEGDRARTFVTGLQVGILLARREAAEGL